MDKLKNSYLMPEESVMLYKTLQYDASKEFKLFGEISFQNNAGIIMGYIKTNEISFNILDFLEKKKIESNLFRQLWQECDWENKIKIKKTNVTIEEFLKDLQSIFKLSLISPLSIRTSKFSTFCLYSRFILGKDLLMNISIEVEDNTVNGNVRLRSQNKGVVVLVARNLRKLNN